MTPIGHHPTIITHRVMSCTHGKPRCYNGNVQEPAKVLFLDDMGWRHSEFTRRTDRMPQIKVWQAHHAMGAIQLLNSVEFDQAFLDHDLSEEDIMIIPGQRSHVPTGMTVVEHIMTMERPPRQIVIHSHNGPAALEMEARLRTHPAGIRVSRCPFALMLAVLDQDLLPKGTEPDRT